jgi:hypothetical protein
MTMAAMEAACCCLARSCSARASSRAPPASTWASSPRHALVLFSARSSVFCAIATHTPLRRTRKPHSSFARPHSSHTHACTHAQLWVDASSWEVLALDVRDSVLYGEQDTVLLSSLRQVGDVILVHDERALERAWAPLGALPLVGADVVTQAGEYLGKARGGWARLRGPVVCAFILPNSNADCVLPRRAFSPPPPSQVRDYEFDPEDGRVAGLIFDAFGVPLVPVRRL